MILLKDFTPGKLYRLETDDVFFYGVTATGLADPLKLAEPRPKHGDILLALQKVDCPTAGGQGKDYVFLMGAKQYLLCGHDVLSSDILTLIKTTSPQ